MGLLSEGSPLSWEETKDLADHVRRHGIKQFINLYHRLKNRQGDVLKWGDEVSCSSSSSLPLEGLFLTLRNIVISFLEFNAFLTINNVFFLR